MPSPGQKDDSTLVDAYNQMMRRVRDSIENAEAQAVPTLQKAIEQARQQAIHLGEVTLEEAEDVGNYIKRDINDAAEYLMETSHEFSEWLLMDIDLVEQKVLELFLSVADKTRLELEQLASPRCEQNPALSTNPYHTGEITGPGTLLCANCGERVSFSSTDQIPACTRCSGNDFRRPEK